MKKMKIWIGVAVLACGFSAARAFANEGHAQGGACQEDAKKFCGDVKPGDGAIHNCMQSHEGELSSACKERMVKGKKNFEEKKKKIEAACGADIKQYCANVTPGEGREFACLKAYEDKISASCKEVMTKSRGKWMRKHGDKKHKEEHKDMKAPEVPAEKK